MSSPKVKYIALVVSLSILGVASSVRSEPLSPGQNAMVRQALNAATLANSPPTSGAANFVANPNIPQIPSFSYKAGTPMPKAIPAALLMMMGNVKDYSPTTATRDAGASVSDLKSGLLSDLPFLSKLPLSSIVTANPRISGLAVRDVFPGWQIPTQMGGGRRSGATTIGQLASQSQGNLPIPASVIATTPTASLPGITETAYGRYPGIGSPRSDGRPETLITAADLPGIPNLRLSKLVSVDVIPTTLQPMKIDTLHTEQSNLSVAAGINVASGSNKEPHAPCTGSCSAVELLSAIDPNNNFNPLNGSYSIIGQKLRGGHGIVGDIMTAAGIREPAGFDVPYIGMNGCGSKWSAEAPNAAGGSVQQQLNLRFCYSIPFLGFQASPYFIPLPLPLPASESQANMLLPMMMTPATVLPPVEANLPRASLPSISVAAAPKPTASSTIASVQPNLPVASLIGTNTITAWSPTLGTDLG